MYPASVQQRTDAALRLCRAPRLAQLRRSDKFYSSQSEPRTIAAILASETPYLSQPLHTNIGKLATVASFCAPSQDMTFEALSLRTSPPGIPIVLLDPLVSQL